jgi:hypothetical protein
VDGAEDETLGLLEDRRGDGRPLEQLLRGAVHEEEDARRVEDERGDRNVVDGDLERLGAPREIVDPLVQRLPLVVER